MNDKLNATQGAIDLAEETGLDLSQVEGTGDGGKIYKTDVEKVLASEVGPAPEQKEESYDGADMHTIVRTISKVGAVPAGVSAFPVMQVDAYVSSWIDEGYELVDTHYLGERPEGYDMMYILLRQ